MQLGMARIKWEDVVRLPYSVVIAEIYVYHILLRVVQFRTTRVVGQYPRMFGNTTWVGIKFSR